MRTSPREPNRHILCFCIEFLLPAFIGDTRFPRAPWNYTDCFCLLSIMTWNHTDVLLSVINLNGWILGFCSRVTRLKGTFVLSYVQNWLLFRGDGVASVWTPNPGGLEFLSWNVHWQPAPVTYLTGYTQFACNSHIGQSFSFYIGVRIFVTDKVAAFYPPISASILGRGRRPCLTGSINVLVLQCRGEMLECVALDVQDSRVGQPPCVFTETSFCCHTHVPQCPLGLNNFPGSISPADSSEHKALLSSLMQFWPCMEHFYIPQMVLKKKILWSSDSF